MRSVVCAALLVIGAGPLVAAELFSSTTLPTDPANAVGVVLTEEPGGWLVFRQTPFEPVTFQSLNGGAGIAWEGPPGQYVVMYFPAGQQIPQPQVTMVKLGYAPQPPPPTPPGPDPPEPPPPTPGQTTGVVWLTILRHKDDVTADQAEVLARIRQWSDQQPAAKVLHYQFPPDSSDPKVQAYAARVPTGASLPYVFISQARTDGRGAEILWHGPLPTGQPDAAAQTVITKVGGYVR